MYTLFACLNAALMFRPLLSIFAFHSGGSACELSGPAVLEERQGGSMIWEML
jgi:hypothetical protein